MARFLAGLSSPKFFALCVALMGLVLYIPVRNYLTRLRVPEADGFLILGGAVNRMSSGARLAKKYPQKPIIVSGSSEKQSRDKSRFNHHNIDPNRLQYVICATDTVTDFTCTLPHLQAAQVRHVYLITDDYHMPRAKAIAYWILGSRGIVFTPYETSCRCSIKESRLRILRDQLRSILWLVSGKTGASLNPRLKARSGS